VISATSGSEATDTAVKIARKWGIMKKGIPTSEMLIFGVGDSFHGLTSGVWSLQNSTKKRAGRSKVPISWLICKICGLGVTANLRTLCRIWIG
jgi:acetylornithine/succinyldiaminopimelate/putrescine aminotransferase